MPFPVKTLEWTDIDQIHPSVQKLETFRRMVDYAIAEGAKVHDLTPGARPWMSMLEQFYWRAEDLYVMRPPGKLASPCDIYHPTTHYLFAKKYGTKLEGRPLCLLLSESLASMTEYYFVLEALPQFGISGIHEVNFIRSLAEFEKKRSGLSHAPTDVNAQMQTDAGVLRFLQSEVGDPYAAFRRSSEELFKYYRYMFETGAKRAGGGTVDYSGYVAHCEKLRYGSFILRFNIGLNVADALAYGGRTPSDEDFEAVRDCLAALNRSKTLLEFLGELGMSNAAVAKTAVAKTAVAKTAGAKTAA